LSETTNRFARAVLLGPDVLSRAAAGRVETLEEAWMLRQPKAIRASYVREVIDAPGDEELLAQIWMLKQSDAIRASYLRDVLEPRLHD
jgi:hypothetical protein